MIEPEPFEQSPSHRLFLDDLARAGFHTGEPLLSPEERDTLEALRVMREEQRRCAIERRVIRWCSIAYREVPWYRRIVYAVGKGVVGCAVLALVVWFCRFREIEHVDWVVAGLVVAVACLVMLVTERLEQFVQCVWVPFNILLEWFFCTVALGCVFFFLGSCWSLF